MCHGSWFCRARLCFGLLVAVLSSNLWGQNPPVNTTLVGHWDGYSGNYSEVTTDGNFLYGGNFARGDGNTARMFVVDITIPSNPTLANEVFIPSPNNFKSPEDVMLADNGLLFVAMETGNADAYLIYDARNPPALPLLATGRMSVYGRAHNIQYHEGFLYICDSTNPRVGIVDLRTFDPDNPPASPITSETWIMTGVGISFVHEILPITLQHPTLGEVKWLFASAWNSGLQIYDISNVANATPTFIGSAPGTATHSCWPTSDAKFVVSGEERSNGGIKVWEIAPAGGGMINLTMTDSLVLTTDSFSVHNQAIVTSGSGPTLRYRLFNAWYQAGLQVHDIDPTSGLLNFVASYDTFPQGNTGTFAGNWSVYPFEGEDKIILADLSEGYYVIDLEQTLFSISYPEGRPMYVLPDGSSQLRVATTPGATTADPTGATMWVQIDNSPFTAIPMTQDVNGDFLGQFPTAPCASTVHYYVEIAAVGGGSISDPLGAPSQTYSAQVYDESQFATIVSYNFQTTTGWTVSSTATAGQWNAGVPSGDGTRGDPTVDFDGSGQCYLTQNGPGDTDVDGGATTLTSPTLNASGLQDAVLSYARWYSNTAGGSPNADIFEVEISNNNGSSWVDLETVGPSGSEVSGGWVLKEFHIADTLPPTSTMRVRFIASDTGMGSVIEAAIDAVAIKDFICDVPVCGDGDVEGSEECDDDNTDNGDGCSSTCTIEVPVCGNGNVEFGEECDDDNTNNGDGCDENCQIEVPPASPVVAAAGSRYLSVTVSGGTDPVALLVTSPSATCLSAYVDSTGELTALPVYRTPAEWSTVFVNGTALLPETAYNVQTELQNGLTSSIASDSLWKYGDVNNDDLVNLDDILGVIAGFQGDFSMAALQGTDQQGCNPNAVIDLDDILADLTAFSGQSLNCTDPCP